MSDSPAEVTEPDRQNGQLSRAGRPADADGRRTVEDLPGGRSRVRIETNVRPHGADRLFSPVLGPLPRRQLTGDLRRLRELAERAPQH